MLDNPMVLSAQREQREQEARARREAHMHGTAIDSFLCALEIGPHAVLAVKGANVRLHELVADVLASDDGIGSLIECVRASRDVGLWLAARYADAELSHYVDEGSLA